MTHPFRTLFYELFLQPWLRLLRWQATPAHVKSLPALGGQEATKVLRRRMP